jgi:hypothetical protein
MLIVVSFVVNDIFGEFNGYKSCLKYLKQHELKQKCVMEESVFITAYLICGAMYREIRI